MHGQIRLRCATQPDSDQAALLDRLGIILPKRMRTVPCRRLSHSNAWSTKLRWRGERDYLELKQKVGAVITQVDHHHATLCVAAYGFLISEKEMIPPPDRPAPGEARNLTFPMVIDPEDLPATPLALATLRQLRRGRVVHAAWLDVWPAFRPFSRAISSRCSVTTRLSSVTSPSSCTTSCCNSSPDRPDSEELPRVGASKKSTPAQTFAPNTNFQPKPMVYSEMRWLVWRRDA
jgi:hypothetical protein